jgi:hypothetical protein
MEAHDESISKLTDIESCISALESNIAYLDRQSKQDATLTEVEQPFVFFKKSSYKCGSTIT